MSAEPRGGVPHMPDYGLAESAGRLPWSWAVERLTASHNYWVSTARPDGRPHVAPVWGVWLDGTFVFSTAAGSRKARNLAANASCVVCNERADEAVIVEGVATEARDGELLAQFRRAYKEKYDWPMDDVTEGIYAVRPRVVFGFIEHADQFTKTATRWAFEEEAT